MSRRLTIGILGPYGTGNLGDAAIQEALMYQVRKLAPESRFCGISLNPRDTEARHGITTFPIDVQSAGFSLPQRVSWILAGESRSLFSRVIRYGLSCATSLVLEIVFLVSMRTCAQNLHVLIVSGGGQITDYWGGPWKQPFAVLRWTVVAKLCGCRVMFLSVGGWELRSWLSRLFMRTALTLADFRSYRDAVTRGFVESIGVPPPYYVFPDLAFGYPVRPIGESNRDRTGRLIIGISPIASIAWTTADDPRYARYLDGLAGFASRMVERGHEVRLFPSQVNMDMPVVAELLKRLRTSLAPAESARVTVIAVNSVEEFLSTVQHVDVVVASRLHGALLSLAARKAVIATFYHQKLGVLMERLGLQRFCARFPDQRGEALDACLDALIAQREDVIEGLGADVTAFRRDLERQSQLVLSIADSGRREAA